MLALPLLKVAAVFSAVVFAIRRKLPLGLALIGGGISVGILQGMPFASLPGHVTDIALAPATSEFVGVLAFVVGLSTLLERSGQIDRLTAAFRNCFSSSRATVAALPSLLGLLPMPGGALFSAPMVQAGARELDMNAEEKTAVNYWFRHIWEYSWPLYPSILFSAQIMGVEVKRLALMQGPLTLVAFLSGIWFLLRRVKAGSVVRMGTRKRAALNAIIVLLPILVIIGVHLSTGWRVVACAGIGFAVAALWHLCAGNLTGGVFLRSLFVNPSFLSMLLMGFGAKIFAEMMARSGAIDGVTKFFLSTELPALLIVLLLPFAVGFFSGLNIVFVTTTFPILLGFGPVAGRPIPHLLLAFAAGHSGTMVSPVHSCLSLSSGYFCSDMAGTMRRILAPVGVTLLAALILLVVYLHLPG